jgi:hypothetical protein
VTRVVRYDRSQGAGTRTEIPSDGYLERLVKYVPAEVLVFFLPTVTLAGPQHPGLVVAILLAGLAATPLWQFVHALSLPADQRPYLHYYFLASIAYVAWAIGASNAVQVVFGLDPFAVTTILAIVVLVVPGLDIVLAHFGW